MNIIVKQISSLEKVRPGEPVNFRRVHRKTLMRGESFSYQIAIHTEENIRVAVTATSPLGDNCIKLYAVKNTAMDYPIYLGSDDDYITKEPGLMPDMLMPIENEGQHIRLATESEAVWVTVKVPKDAEPGVYPVTVTIAWSGIEEYAQINQVMYLDVINEVIPEQSTTFTQWFHTDCIADVHNVPVYSEAHWDLIDKYMALASEMGINMILTPVITPPLDTAEGLRRTCVQLVKIEKQGDTYLFDFSLLKRWISLVNKNSIKYIEISHLFSQWGLKYAPNIVVTENGEESYMFGWHVDSKSDEYRNFLTQFLPALIKFLEDEGIKDRCWFHVSDEPNGDHIENYKYAYNLIKPLIGDCQTFDALSNYDFYKTGLVGTPVPSTYNIQSFIDHKVPNLWTYYCCGQHYKVGNRFLAMPSHRNRILGLQLYKFNVVGFLHWGYNFYNSEHSRNKINPYITSSSDKGFPSGDAFSVYPITNGVVPSLRAIVFKDALNDIEICHKLESFIGRDEVVKMIDTAAGMDLTFSEYPRNSAFIPDLIEKMEQMIKSYTAK